MIFLILTNTKDQATTIAMGDFNVKIGVETENVLIRSFALGIRNEGLSLI